MAPWLDLAFGALTGILAAVPSLIVGVAAGFGAMEGASWMGRAKGVAGCAVLVPVAFLVTVALPPGLAWAFGLSRWGIATAFVAGAVTVTLVVRYFTRDSRQPRDAAPGASGGSATDDGSRGG